MKNQRTLKNDCLESLKKHKSNVACVRFIPILHFYLTYTEKKYIKNISTPGQFNKNKY